MKPPIVPFVGSARETSRWLSILQAAMPRFRVERLEALDGEERASVEVAITANPDPTDLRALPNLRWIQSLWAGVDRLLGTLDRDDLAVVRMVDPELAETMAEAVLAWTLYLHRDMPRYLQQQRDRVWRHHELPPARERRVSVLGLGHLGRPAVVRLRDNGFSVAGWSRRAAAIEGVHTRHGPDGLADTLAESEVLVVLLPLTPTTRGLLQAETLRQLPQGAAIINLARGPIVDEAALLSGLDSGHLSHAVLDVFATEPLPADHPFWGHPSITVLPHVAAPTNPATACALAKVNLDRYFASGVIPAAVSRAAGY